MKISIDNYYKFFLSGHNNRYHLLARNSMYAVARYMLSPVHPSVRPSVHLSVCLSHGWISQKW